MGTGAEKNESIKHAIIQTLSIYFFSFFSLPILIQDDDDEKLVFNLMI